MLRITRLHLLLAVVGVICLLFGMKDWWGEQRGIRGHKALPRARVARATPQQGNAAVSAQESAAMEQLKKNVAQSLATIGEAYRPLRRRFGDIPRIGKPLQAAKFAWNRGDYDSAMRMARISWSALKTFRKNIDRIPESYQVVRGDTLWRIAAMHSPARAGAGWVTIWRANQSIVNNFNRIEVGMMLKIPPRRAQYVMPFWRPHTP